MYMDMTNSYEGKVLLKACKAIAPSALRKLKIPPIEMRVEEFLPEYPNVSGRLCICTGLSDTSNYIYLPSNSHIEVFASTLIQRSASLDMFLYYATETILHELRHHYQLYYGRAGQLGLLSLKDIAMTKGSYKSRYMEMDAEEWSGQNLHHYYKKVRRFTWLLRSFRAVSDSLATSGLRRSG